MEKFFIFFISLLIEFPIVSTIFIYMFLKLFFKNNKRKLLLFTLDFSTILYISSFYFILNMFFPTATGWILINLLLIILFISIILQWKAKRDIRFFKLLKGFWRISFISFFILHFITLIAGLALKISEYNA
ncbi:DUF3397 family protein [Bacillus sp. EAC]|uniref:DUF3397 family protein n=1 Tax=Bacillus sp. EAC TaxID=1978338 RepID=UPI000B433127|nr:DUF3397 family protein [Bacillus sp. EAC]